jgi:hypothetical protein
MSQPVYRANTIRFSRQTVPIELFPDSIQAAFDRLEQIGKSANREEVSPSTENIEWAKKVLLRVLPSYYLLGAEIDAFQREIHVNWEHKNKRIVAFLPAPDQLKIYCEEVRESGDVDHRLHSDVNDLGQLSAFLGWMFRD